MTKGLGQIRSLEIEVKNKDIRFQDIDPSINTDQWDEQESYLKVGWITLAEEEADEIIQKLKEHPEIIAINKTLTPAGIRLCAEKEALCQKRQSIYEAIKDTHLEVSVVVKLPFRGIGVPFDKIDPRIINIDKKEPDGSLIIFIPKEALEEIIEKLKESRYLSCVKEPYELNLNEKKIVFSYSQHTKNYAKLAIVAGVGMAVIGYWNYKLKIGG